MKRAISILFLVLLLASILPLSHKTQCVRAEPRTWIVDDDGPADFHTIQEAIDAASDGDSIYVKGGEYQESIKIDRSLHVLGDLGKTILVTPSVGPGFDINASSANVTGFTIHCWGPGFKLSNCENCYVMTNTIFSGWGIELNNTRKSTFIGNCVILEGATQGGQGIEIHNSRNNVFKNNTVSGKFFCDFLIDGDVYDYFQDIDETNLVNGRPICYLVNQANKQTPPDAGFVAVVNCSCILVRNLNVTDVEGVLLVLTSNSTVEKSRVKDCVFGVLLMCSCDNIVRGNKISDVQYGVVAYEKSNNTVVESNDISNGEMIGIFIWDSYHNTVVSSNNVSSFDTGIWLWDSESCRVYHNNFINNSRQANPGGRTWDDGYPSGGNYWSDYNGTDLFSGPFQNVTGRDGLGDTPYVVYEGNRDRYPLMSPYAPLHADLNMDGTVNILDIFIIARAFGSMPGDSNWNSIADVSKDGTVNILDIFAVAWNFGKTVERL